MRCSRDEKVNPYLMAWANVLEQIIIKNKNLSQN